MDFLARIISIIDANLISCLIPMILTLMLIGFLFKDKFPTREALNLLRWIIISYAALVLLHLTIRALFNQFEFGTITIQAKAYSTTHWILMLASTIFPFTLLIKKLASKYAYLLLVAFSMKMGVFFEYFVIFTTSFHHDKMTENGIEITSAFWMLATSLLLQGFLLAILLSGIASIKVRPVYKNKSSIEK